MRLRWWKKKNVKKATVRVEGVDWNYRFINVSVSLTGNRVEIILDEPSPFFGIMAGRINFPASMCVIIWEE